jgi:PKD repeat protein
MTAAFAPSCAGLVCSFDGGASTSSTGITAYAWDWGDGTGSSLTVPSAMHTYAAPGHYVATLSVSDASGDTMTDGEQVLVTSQPANPSFTVLCNQMACTYNGSYSSRGDAAIVDYSWTFGDGTSADGTITTSTTYAGGGNYRVSLTLTDAFGVTSALSQTVTVNGPPQADFTATCSGLSCTFDASGTLGASAIVAYAWNFGDATTGTGVTPSHSYSTAGTYTVTLTATDANSQTGSVSYAVLIYAPPTTSFTFSCPNSLTCSFYSATNDALQPTTWTWSFGDGTVVTNPGSLPWDPTYTYAEPGLYTVTLTVTDTAENTASASQAVLANIAPVAANDVATTVRDTPVTIDVLANDSDADGDPLTIANVSLLSSYPGAAYQLIQLASGRWGLVVTPPNAFVGTLTFTYQACDPWGACSAPATVTLTVTSAAIDAIGEQFYTYQNQTLYISVAELLANVYVSQATQLPLTISYDTSILMGTLSCTSTTCTYTPPLGAAGFTLFRYTVTDSKGNQDTAPVRIYVGLTDSQKVTASDIYLSTTWNTPITFTYNDVAFQAATDADGDTLTIGLASQKTLFGNLVCSTPMYTCTYTPNTGYAGTDRFAYTATDMINPSVTAYINILTMPLTTPTFDARGGVVVTGENEPVYIGSGILANDYLPNGGPEVVTSFSTSGLQGSLSCTASGCTYTPPYAGFQGTTSFTYTATDSHGATDTAAVKICVACTNHPPVATPQTLAATENEPLRFSVFNLMNKNYDPDDDPLFMTVFAVSAKLGTLNCGTPNYWCTYTPNANTTGSDVITYELSDGQAYVESTVTITISPSEQ